MQKKKVLFVATVVKTHMMQFHIPYLKMFQEMGWETAVASKNDYENPADCVIPYCDTYYDIPFERLPWKPRNIQSYKMLKKIIDEGNYDIIHCHTPVGAMIARLASLSARKRGQDSEAVQTGQRKRAVREAPPFSVSAPSPSEGEARRAARPSVRGDSSAWSGSGSAVP